MRYLLPTLLVVAGCSGSSNPCALVKCASGSTCNPLNGFCFKSDSGLTDAGALPDSGVNPVDAGQSDAGSSDGGCPTPCTGGTKACDPVTRTCVQCVSDLDCGCPAYACVSNICRTPAVDPDAGTVVGGPPPAESCSAAQPFTFRGCTVPRSFTFRANVLGRSDDEEGVCAVPLSGGPDLVYVMSLEAAYDITVTVSPVSGSLAEPLVYLRRMPCTGQELACTDSGGMGFGASVTARNRPAGEYAIFIDSYDSGGGGEVDITITLGAPTPPGNETCLSADPIPTDGGRVRADLSLARNDENLFCNRFGLASPDLAWRFVLSAPGNIIARAVAVDPDAGVVPVVEIRSGCSTSSLVACGNSTSATGNAGLFVRGAPAGVYHLLVEGWDAGVAGQVDVSVSVLPPSPPLLNDTCAAARDIVFADGGTFTEFDVDTATALDDEDGSCNDPADPIFPGPGGPEYVYRLRLLAPRNVTIIAAPAPNNPTDPVLFVRQGVCTNPNTEVACNDDIDFPDNLGSIFASTGLLSAGDYFIFIEGRGADVGATHVTVSATP